MDFEEVIKQFQNGEIEKDKFIELTIDRLSFLDTERKAGYKARDEAQKESPGYIGQ